MMDDVIYRHVLRDAMYHEAFEVDSDLQKWDGGCWIRYKMFENVIDKIPSAQKKGHWNFVGDNLFKCTCCGEMYTTQQLNGLRVYDKDPYCPFFCPHCGADMREEAME